MNSDEQQTTKPAKLWWESPWVMIALVVLISLLGAVDQGLN
tara:strand:- start:158 stop:280 length:123 start_codon:yes stop_codon:yes gene_type:complete